ncbi:hypothetical protein Ahy_A01g002979 isoform F [Arachis hypogaea]|uniref:Uncharacterized protein n=1 Tax=Arachis hypogaea TaxID=3818 RepID=A0A445ESE7_ARAHY|nr:hypothetical protein Ahy_A01g002979 isoform F [Arachis hypogaea]
MDIPNFNKTVRELITRLQKIDSDNYPEIILSGETWGTRQIVKVLNSEGKQFCNPIMRTSKDDVLNLLQDFLFQDLGNGVSEEVVIPKLSERCSRKHDIPIVRIVNHVACMRSLYS